MSFPVYNPAPMIERYRRFEALERGEQREQQRFEALEQDRLARRENELYRQGEEIVKADPDINIPNLNLGISAAKERRLEELKQSLLRQRKREEAKAGVEETAQLGATPNLGPAEQAALQQARGRYAGFPGLEADVARRTAVERVRARGGLPPQTGPEAVTERERARADVRARARESWVTLFDSQTSQPFRSFQKGDPQLAQFANQLDETGQAKYIATQVNISGGAAEVIKPTKKVDIIQQAFQIDEAQYLLSDLVGSVLENRNRAGMAVYLKKAAQQGRGMAQTIDDLLGSNLSEVVENAQLDMQARLMNRTLYPADEKPGDVDQEEKAARAALSSIAFDADVASNEVASRMLAFALWRDSRGGLRSATSFNKFSKLVNLNDIRGADAVVSKFLKLSKIYERRRKQVEAIAADQKFSIPVGPKPRYSVSELILMDKIARKHGLRGP